ncbi:MAG: MBOAT family protein [Candidatus Phocaeicola faecipullorum]|nr:MBOAT family protein [Candidatus Phocaeicola faecipullorum]
MLFNSFEYIIFIIAVFVLFVATNRKQTLLIRNFILLAASWYFYSCLHWWFVMLLLYTTTVNYLCGRWIDADQNKGRNGKAGTAVSIILSLTILIVFKYAYVFDSSILLPVGLSFFTFQALTYTIDIYRKKIPVEYNPINVALFISFFPTLLSGPIERARNLLPQLRQKSTISWESITSGAGLFVWGLFKKVVIADRLAQYVNLAYLTPEGQSGSTLAVAAVFYSFQIYCDFSGYADMAIASGRILGFSIMQNFNFPYCVNTIKEFWRRWHISLTSWFTEYVYISMGGNRVIKPRWILNISTVFLLSGIWHGATWSFVLWGALHAAYYFLEYYLGPKKGSPAKFRV